MLTPQLVFSIANAVALVGWIALILSYRYEVLGRLVASAIIAGLAVAYSVLFVPLFFSEFGFKSFSSVEAVATLFKNPWALTAGWVHYLAFDLFVGMYEVREARKIRLPVWLLLPCLFLTFMFGPFGYLVFLCIKLIKTRPHWHLIRARWLSVATLAFLVFAFVLVCLMQIDPREFQNAEVWIKPFKFAISFAIFCPTIALLLQFAPFSSAKALFYDRAITILSIGEFAIIALQAGRGIGSHFNISSPVNTALWASMGVMIAILTLLVILIGVSFWRARSTTHPEMRAAVMGAAVLFVIAAISGFIMASLGRHTIGAPDGGLGLPFFGWSTSAGDLRVSHFVALHAAQILPVIALVSRRYWPQRAVSLTALASIAYASAATALMAAALAGLSLF